MLLQLGILCAVLVVLAFVVVQRSENDGLRDDVQNLTKRIRHMATGQEMVAQDIATIKTQVTSMAAAYTAAAAAAQEKALADAKAAWEADDEAKWAKAHEDLSGVISAMNAGQPITPPATATDPSPAPVPAPSADVGTTATPAAGVPATPPANDNTGTSGAAPTTEAPASTPAPGAAS